MGNQSCLCEKQQIYNTTSLKNSRILEEPSQDQQSDCNGSNNENNKNNANKNKLSLKSQNIAKLRQKYGTRNCIEEEETSSIYESVYSDMINNSIYNLPSLISSEGHNHNYNNGRSDCYDAKNAVSSSSASACRGGGGGGKHSLYNSQSINLKTSSSNQQSNSQQSKHKHYQITLDVLITGIALSNPEGDRMKQGQKVILRHLNSEMNLHSHYRKYEKGSKLQEVSACQSKTIHQHDFWIIDVPQNYYKNLNQSNRVWAQIDKYQGSDDTATSQSNENLAYENADSQTHSTTKIVGDDSESNFLKTPYINDMDAVIFKHCVTEKELASSNKFIHTSSKSQQVYCDELSTNFQFKESFNWKIVVHNSDGYLRDNSIIQIIHSETNRPLSTNKQNGILSQTVEVACRNKEYSAANRQINDFWIINRVQTDSSILRAVEN